MGKYILFSAVLLASFAVITTAFSLASPRGRVSLPTKAAGLTNADDALPVFVTASAHSLTPSSFRVSHLKSITLRITAVDADYPLSLPEFGISQSVMKGETADIVVKGLGEGSYTLQCGTGCSAAVIVENADDLEK